MATYQRVHSQSVTADQGVHNQSVAADQGVHSQSMTADQGRQSRWQPQISDSMVSLRQQIGVGIVSQHISEDLVGQSVSYVRSVRA